MPIPLDSPEVLNREFSNPAWLLQVAAALDRLDRAEGSADGDARLAGICRALAILADETGRSGREIQLVFSRQYDANWKTTGEDGGGRLAGCHCWLVQQCLFSLHLAASLETRIEWFRQVRQVLLRSRSTVRAFAELKIVTRAGNSVGILTE